LSEGLSGPRTAARLARAPLRLSPQRPRRHGIVGLEEPERGDIVAVRPLPPVVDRGHAADDAAVAAREEEIDVGVREERVLARVASRFRRGAAEESARIGAIAIMIVNELPELGLLPRPLLAPPRAFCIPPGGLLYQQWLRSTTYTLPSGAPRAALRQMLRASRARDLAGPQPVTALWVLLVAVQPDLRSSSPIAAG
jgi:hypothetical protein